MIESEKLLVGEDSNSTASELLTDKESKTEEANKKEDKAETIVASNENKSNDESAKVEESNVEQSPVQQQLKQQHRQTQRPGYHNKPGGQFFGKQSNYVKKQSLYYPHMYQPNHLMHGAQFFGSAAASSGFFLPPSVALSNPGASSLNNQPNAAGSNYFYNTNSFESKQSYHNHRNYIQNKKVQNQHKLWPHSAKKSTQAGENSKNNELSPSSSKTSSCEENKTSNETNPTEKTQNEIAVNKTSMCLINELVKFNKIKHEYVLDNETGPAHKKTFFVTLKLGIGTENEESYNGNGTSIKKAQHAAAESALKATKYKMPSSRPKKKIDLNPPNSSDLTKRFYDSKLTDESNVKKPNSALAPTVLLNSLAMKLGLVANYQHLSTEILTDNESKDNKPNSTSAISQSSNQQSNDSNEDNQITPTVTSNENSTPETNAQPSEKEIPQESAASTIVESLPIEAKIPNTVAKPTTSEIATSSDNTNQLNHYYNNHKYYSNPFKGHFNTTNYNNNYRLNDKRYKFGKLKTRNSDAQRQLFKVKLSFADQEFEGEGTTLQLAKHNAASKAFEHFSKTENFIKAKTLASSTANKNVKAYRPPQYLNQSKTENVNTNKKESNGDSKPVANGARSSAHVTILKKAKSNQDSQKEPVDQNNGEKKQEASLTEVKETEAEITPQEKSEISILHEYAYRLKKTVSFELVQESGPSHIKKFTTKCTIGIKSENEKENESCYFEVQGEGNSKKASKKQAAIAMIKILKDQFEPLLTIKSKQTAANGNIDSLLGESSTGDGAQSTENKKKPKKQRGKNIIKIKKTNPDYGIGSINPISRLIQIQQGKKEPEPIFELISTTSRVRGKNEFSRRNEFLMQVTIKTANSNREMETLKCEGKGSTKKSAKQNAAEAMLVKLGFQPKVQNQPSIKPVLKNPTPQVASTQVAAQSASQTNLANSNSSNQLDENDKTNSEKNEKKVKFIDENSSTTTDQPAITKTNSFDNKQLSNKKLTIIEKKQNGNAKVLDNFNHHNNHRNHHYHHHHHHHHHHYNNHQNRLKIYKEQVSLARSAESYNTYFDNETLENVYKIAQELLESIASKKNVTTENNNSTSVDVCEFYSKTAELIMKKVEDKLINPDENGGGSSQTTDTQENSSCVSETNEDDKLQLKLLTRDATNYKKALEYLSNVMNFKVNYQSLLGRDGSVNSYVSLSILSEMDKPLNGQGATHVESSNAAALCALQYLSSKIKLKK